MRAGNACARLLIRQKSVKDCAVTLFGGTAKRKGEEEEKNEKGNGEASLSFRCGHGPSGRTIFYRIYLSRVLSSMKESLAWKFLALLINSCRDKMPRSWPRSNSNGGDFGIEMVRGKCRSLVGDSGNSKSFAILTTAILF